MTKNNLNYLMEEYYEITEIMEKREKSMFVKIFADGGIIRKWLPITAKVRKNYLQKHGKTWVTQEFVKWLSDQDLKKRKKEQAEFNERFKGV